MTADAIQLPIAIRRKLLLALVAGLTIALSLPPWGWWPLAVAGGALLYRLVDDAGWRQRALIGWVFGIGQFGVGLFWMTEFTLPGGVLAIVFSALFIAAGA